MRYRIAVLIALLMISSHTAFAEDPSTEFLNGGRKTFSTQGHPKAKGVNFSIAYPASWVAKEGERPNVVQSFVSDGGRGLETCLILTKSLDLPTNTEISDVDLASIFSGDELRSIVPDGANIIGTSMSRIEGLPMAILEYSMKAERAGISIDTQSLIYIFIHRGTMVQIQFSITKPPLDRVDLSQKMSTYKPLFSLMVNSIVIPDRWEQSSGAPLVRGGQSSPSNSNGGTTILVGLLMSFLLTWGIGLAPSILIRYLIWRRPLSRVPSSIIAATTSLIFWVIFRIINIALGEKPGTGWVWILVFFISGIILSRGSGKGLGRSGGVSHVQASPGQEDSRGRLRLNRLTPPHIAAPTSRYLDPDTSALEADSAYREQNLQEEAEYYRKMIREGRQPKWSIGKLAHIYRQMGRIEDAEACEDMISKSAQWWKDNNERIRQMM